MYLSSIAFAQNALVRSGPMLGYSSMKEVGIWIQLEKEAEVKVRYWPVSNEKDKKETAISKKPKREFIYLSTHSRGKPRNKIQLRDHC